jgi:hypothetical protein
MIHVILLRKLIAFILPEESSVSSELQQKETEENMSGKSSTGITLEKYK